MGELLTRYPIRYKIASARDAVCKSDRADSHRGENEREAAGDRASLIGNTVSHLRLPKFRRTWLLHYRDPPWQLIELSAVSALSELPPIFCKRRYKTNHAGAIKT